jgi:hypothetical protein
MTTMPEGQELSEDRLAQVKRNLKAGSLQQEDLRALEALVERTEAATRSLRAAIVE